MIHVVQQSLSALKPLKINKYKPNLNDPRTVRRIKAVLDWCDEMRLYKHARSISQSNLRKVFGNTSQGLGRWTYSNLLIQQGTYIPALRSFSYMLRQDGYEKLHALIGVRPATNIEIARRKFGLVVDGFQATTYSDEGGRRYAAVQNLPRLLRQELFGGWWDYDIEASAPTLVFQYATYKCHSVSSVLPHVAKLIHEKTWVRTHVASITGLGEQDVKKVVNALFFDAPLVPHSATAIYRLVDCDELVLSTLKVDPFIMALKAEVKQMWIWACERYRNTEIGVKCANRSLKNSKLRNAIYIMLERCVIDALDEVHGNCPSVLMHDGFMLRQRTDVAELARVVKRKTGLNVQFKEKRLGESDSLGDGPDPLWVSGGEEVNSPN
ncbi:MAG: hypothetical protein I8H90_25025 [Burkholderiales bacterium]|nr:hypothetical protein [Burkholderiales bacterium]